MTTHQTEIARGERFTFGRNWNSFLQKLNDQRIALAEQSLQHMLGMSTLEGRSFLDIGSGSGLFSLAARRLGADVHSFDYDPASVGCTRTLRERFFPDDPRWTIHEGSVLDKAFLQRFGQVDVVYSWGVLHHTGQMWEAVGNAATAVKPGGLMYISLYNDEGPRSKIWHWVKKTYNRLPLLLRIPFATAVVAVREMRALLVATAKLQPWDYFRSWIRYHQVGGRGMSRRHDIVDWIGGYPFEVAKPDDVLAFCRERGFELIRLVTTRGPGCNEYLFLCRAAKV